MTSIQSTDKSVSRSRRRYLLGALAASGAALTDGAVTFSQAATAGGIKQDVYAPVSSAEEALMAAERMRTVALSSGDQGYGAVVVKDSVVVGAGASRVISAQDPTAHAEMEAIRDAARRLKTRDLSGCLLYSTSPPCGMCETAAYWGRVDGLVQRPMVERGDQPVRPGSRRVSCG